MPPPYPVNQLSLPKPNLLNFSHFLQIVQPARNQVFEYMSLTRDRKEVISHPNFDKYLLLESPSHITLGYRSICYTPPHLLRLTIRLLIIVCVPVSPR